LRENVACAEKSFNLVTSRNCVFLFTSIGCNNVYYKQLEHSVLCGHHLARCILATCL